MKIKVLLALLLVAVSALYADAKKKADNGEPLARFQTQVWDFGTIREDKPVSHDFEFVNIGNGNFVIINATAQCGCPRPEYPDKPIAPGKKDKVRVTFNPLGRPGSFEKTVTLTTNGKPKKIRLKIRGNVIPK